MLAMACKQTKFFLSFPLLQQAFRILERQSTKNWLHRFTGEDYLYFKFIHIIKFEKQCSQFIIVNTTTADINKNKIYIMRCKSKQICPKEYHNNNHFLRSSTGDKNHRILKQNEVRIGKYKYDTRDELGKGYSSVVYKGVEIKSPHKRYAVKVVNLNKFRGSNLELLEAEVQIHSTLEHENIVKLIEVIKTSHHYYLVMEYCPHGNLLEYITQRKELSESSVLDIMGQIIKGYKYLIEKSIIHRDIKPGNVMRVGNKWKISDFGFSVRSRCGFRDRINVGTPLYMAPETHRKNYYSFRTDIFSMGVLLHEMLLGRTPWEANNEKELLKKMVEQAKVPPKLKHKGLVNFLERTCQLDESRRFTIEEFKEFDFKMNEQYVYETLTPFQSRDSTRKKSSTITSTSSSKKFPPNSDQGSGASSKSKKAPNPMIKNKNKLIHELSYVQLFHACVKNIQSFIIEEQQKDILGLTFFKMLLKMLRGLCDNQKNMMNLNEWQQYRQCRMYSQLHTQFIQLSQKYESEYLEFIKCSDIRVIRTVNRRFPQLSQNCTLSLKYFENFKQFMSTILQNHNNNLLEKISQKDLTEPINDHYEALEKAYIIYNMADRRANCEKSHTQTDTFTINEDFAQSKLHKYDYLNLRRLIKM